MYIYVYCCAITEQG